MKNPFKADHGFTFDPRSLAEHIIGAFLGESETDVVENKITLVLHEPRDDVFAKIKGLFSEARITMPAGTESIFIHAEWSYSPVLLVIYAENFPDVDKYSIRVLAPLGVSKVIADTIKSMFEDIKHAGMKWWYNGNHGLQTREVFMPPSTQVIHPEFYPDFDPHTVLDNYMHSDESVLIMAGPPGTGKTSLLRHMIIKYKLAAHIIYDEQIMKKDTPFQSFLFDEDEDGIRGEHSANAVMVIEDADTILLAREDDGNTMMSRFLNISDGLIKLPNRKLVFTTNLLNLDKVDDALLRPGRCFGVIHTRELNLTEAQAAARAAGVAEPTENMQYTLASIFNRGEQRVKKFGFGFKAK